MDVSPQPSSSQVDATDISVTLPDAEARARAARRGRKPLAEVSVSLSNGGISDIVVPVRVGRLLDTDAIALPLPVDDAFDAIHALELRVCFSLLTEMLSRRDYACAEMRSKLAAYGFRDIEIEEALRQAQDRRYLDDARFSRYFIYERLRRGWGRVKIEAELRRRGVSLEEIPGYPEEFFDEQDDLARALDALARKSVPASRPREKLVRFLVSRGYSFSVANEAVRSYLNDIAEN